MTGPGGLIPAHARARHLFPALTALIALAVVSGLGSRWLSSQTSLDRHLEGHLARLPVVVMGALVAAVLVSVTLSGADVDLERTVPRLTRGSRAVHALAAVALAAGILAAATTPHALDFAAAAMVRNTAGLVGLILVSVTLLPSALSWAPTFGYAVLTLLAGPRSADRGAAWWAWPLQPGPLDASWTVAALLLSAGAILYAVRGPARR